jgi:hypothetical protein
VCVWKEMSVIWVKYFLKHSSIVTARYKYKREIIIIKEDKPLAWTINTWPCDLSGKHILRKSYLHCTNQKWNFIWGDKNCLIIVVGWKGCGLESSWHILWQSLSMFLPGLFWKTERILEFPAIWKWPLAYAKVNFSKKIKWNLSLLANLLPFKAAQIIQVTWRDNTCTMKTELLQMYS